MDGKEYKLLNYLSKNCRGRGRSVKGKYLEAMFDLRDTAEVRKIVNNLRVHGYPVGSGNTGYYFMTNADEVGETIRGMWGRINAMMMAIDGLEEARRKIINNLSKTKEVV